jgi:type VI secretion system secreted protein VgrG
MHLPTTTDTAASLQIATPLGGHKLVLDALEGEEAISEPFFFRLSLHATEDGLDASTLIGEGLTVTLVDGSGNKRIIHGRATRATISNDAWNIELRPWLWLLHLTTDHKIFQSKTAPEIIKAVFDGLGYSDYQDSLTGSYESRDYCVQYGESAFNFVSRLMEEEGIWYFFTHEDGKHTLVLADDASAAPACANAATVEYLPLAVGREWVQDIRISSLTLEQRVVTGKYQADDFNFETPSTELKATAAGSSGSLQVYEYPGLYAKKDKGDALSKKRIEELEADATLVSGTSTVRHFVPGSKVTITGAANDTLNAAWILRWVNHRVARNEYDNRFIAHPGDCAYRPPRRAVKPRIAGSQTAVVVGKAGEEIWTDKYGRIKVQFHWDQLGSKDENSSCWIRVAQSWAGKSWGAWVLPRLGQEVVVSFLEGDPDRPLVTGCVYNGDNPLPYTLPDDQTKTTLKSNSSKGGGGSNEIRLEDKKDSEEIYVHAQKDMNTTVENARTLTVNEADDTITIKKGNRSVTIDKGNHSLTVTEGNDSVTVSKGTRAVSVKDNETHDNQADYTHTVKGNCSLTVTGDLTIKASGSITIKGDKDVTIQAGTALTLKAGTDWSGKAGTGATLEGGTTLDLKGSASGTLDGGGMLTVKGGMVKIN